jgi:hypothetical protein
MQKLSLISIEPEPLPSFSQVMKEIESLMRLLYESLDAGATVCRRYYDEHCDGENPEAHLREMIVRDQAKRYLAKNGLRVTELKERRLRLATEPLISLLLHYRGFALRVLKAKKGTPPGCGMSKRRKKFYSQVSVRYLGDDGRSAGSKTNLLALWDFGPGFGIGNVWLACPEVAGARSQDVVLAWQELIPNPVVQRGASPEQMREGARMDERADQELEELLLGTDTTSATDLEEEADDRQSDKVGA